jgi:hypothetical protein
MKISARMLATLFLVMRSTDKHVFPLHPLVHFKVLKLIVVLLIVLAGRKLSVILPLQKVSLINKTNEDLPTYLAKGLN